MQVASQHAKAVGQGSGISVEKRLLLDGIALHASDITPGNVELPAEVVTDFANPWLALRNGTAMPASEAANAISLNLLVELALADVPIQNCTERRHLNPLLHSNAGGSD